MRILPISVTEALLTLAPHGGQRTARRNAWTAMITDAAVARDRREATQAISVAEAAAADSERRVLRSAR